ncbi:MAG: SDR family NAD(P)-dependent oxidoreductase [Planctomycetota bacterium]
MSAWSGKVVAVTGGSEGLGKAIAEGFASRGASVVILARNKQKNQAAANELSSADAEVVAIECDVTQDESVAGAIDSIVARFGRIDAWVNNVGKSTRADVTQADVEDYRELLEINFLSVVRCSRMVFEHLHQSSGYLINIGSLAGRTAWPLVAPYSTSKHAVAAFTDQFRLETAGRIHVLHVCTGPVIRPEDPGQQIDRYEHLSEGLPGEAARPGAGAPVKGIPAATVATRIIRACEKRQAELIIPWRARLLFVASRLSTRLGDWLIRRTIK